MHLISVVVIESGVEFKELIIFSRSLTVYCVSHAKLISHTRTIQLSAIVELTVHNAIDNKYMFM